MALRQIVHTWMYGPMALERVAEGLRRVGADGADLTVSLHGPTNTPEVLMGQDIRRIMTDLGLTVPCVTPLFMSPELDLCHSDAGIRKAALDFSKRSVDVAAFAGSKLILVSPSYISVNWKIHRSYEQDWDQALESMRTLAEYAAACGVTLMIEPINRYRVSLVHTVGEALRMVKALGMPNVGIVPDTFHMNMEESAGVAGALMEGGSHVKCLHIGDNNRKTPGYGALDWRAVIEALEGIGFDGPLSYEPVFLYFDEQKVAQDEAYRGAFEQQLTFGIEYLRTTMDSLARRRVADRKGG